MKQLILLTLVALTAGAAGATAMPEASQLHFIGSRAFASPHKLAQAAELTASRIKPHADVKMPQSQTPSRWLSSRVVMENGLGTKKEKLDSVIGYDNAGNISTRQIFKFDDEGRLLSRENALRYFDTWETVEQYEYKWNDQGLIASEQCIGYGSGMRYDYIYNSLGLGIQKLTSYYTDDEWVLSEKGEYQYDENANITDELLSMKVEGEWVPVSHTIVTYTTLNRQASYEGYSWINGAWEGFAKENYAYFADTSDRLTRVERFLWEPSAQSFRNADIIIQDFNEAGLCTLQKRVFWNVDRQDWSGVYPSWNSDMCYNIKTDLTYDSRNRMTSDIAYTDFEGDGEWTLTGDMLYTYTDLPDDTYRMEMTGNLYQVYPGEIYNDQKRYGLYNAEGRNLWMVQQVRESFNSDLINDYEEKFEYDSFGNTLRYATWNWDGLNRIPEIREVNEYDTNGDISEQHFYFGQEGFSQPQPTLVGSPEWDDSDVEGWVNATKFSYEYVNGTRISKMGWMWSDNQWLANFGADVEYDFDVPMSELIFPDADDPYKIISTGSYTGTGGTEFDHTVNKYFYSKIGGSGVDVAVAETDIVFDGNEVRVSHDGGIAVYDLTGTIVLSTDGNTADVTSLAPGIYVVVAGNNSLKIVKR